MKKEFGRREKAFDGKKSVCVYVRENEHVLWLCKARQADR